MKKLLVLLSVMIGFTIGADVKPFVFENVATDDSIQQMEWDILMKYKVFGAYTFNITNNSVRLTDKSGWVGTSKGDLTLAQNGGDTLGGPIIVGGDLTFKNGPDVFTTGPLNVYGNVNVTEEGFKDRANIFNGFQCVKGIVASKYANFVPNENEFFGNNYENCPIKDTHPNDTNLVVPYITTADTTYQPAISIDNRTDTIVVPDGSYKEPYDLYIDKITFANAGKLVISQQSGGRLTRIFLKNGISYSNNCSIVVAYRDSITGENVELENSDYSGTLLFYSLADITTASFNKDVARFQGSIISYGKIEIAHHMVLAGQLLANNMQFDTDFDGSTFFYVPFDPPVLNIDPTALASGKFVENNIDVKIPITLDTIAKTTVYFNYCFDLNNSTSDVDDFNGTIPICGQDSGSVTILDSTKTPVNDVFLNVKVDNITELDETLKFKIFNLSGAVLPGNVHTGYFTLTLTDGDVFQIDTTKTYSVDENIANVDIGIISVIGKTDSTKLFLSPNDTAKYNLDSITGSLVLKFPYDYETTQYDTITVIANDTASTDTAKIVIKITDVNEAPSIEDQTLTLFENLPIPSIVGTVVVFDQDIDTVFRQNLFKIIEGDTSTFFINNNGQITAAKIFNYETDDTVFTLKVRVYDKNDPTLSDTATVTIKISDTNERPRFATDDTTLVVKENVPAGIIGSIPATDEDGDSISYKIVGNVPFTVDSVGNISSTREFDYETETGFQFKLVATDGTMTDTVKINVKIENVNEPLTVKDTTFTIPEDSVGVIGKIDGVDEDGDDIKYNISDSSNYIIDDNGVLSIKEPFDYEKQQFDTLYVYATDGEFTDTAIVIIKIENVNEPPVLQPNDSLRVEENCDTCTVGVITAIDPDIDDKIIYEVIEPGFTIDSTGTLKTTEPIDYETTKEIIVTVVAKDTSGASDTLKYTVKIDDVNEPVHVKDTTCTIKENYTGDVCKIPATDDDGLQPKYIVTDTINYSIDSTGQLVIKNPIDFENKPIDTVTVIVSDGVFYDTAKVVIKIEDVPEQTKITEVDDKPKQDTIKTNNPDHKIDWKICEGNKCVLDSIDVIVHKDTTIRVCNEKKTSCDEVVILFNDVPPVVTLTNAKSTDTWIDYITIEEQKDDKIYVNKKENPITVTVKDTVRNTTKTFDISVKLDTLSSKDIKLNDYNYVIDELKSNIIPIGDNKAEIVEIINDNGTEIVIKKIVDLKTMLPVDTIQTVSYTKTINGKDVVISYKTDNMTGERLTDYTVSYMIDSCTSVSYTMNDKKQIVKNEEGNIGYTITYDYVDDFGNKATASVDLVYDDIPPKVEIISPYNNDIFNTNAVNVKWTVNGEVQDTLTLQRLEKGANFIIRRYVDKAGNEACDTVRVIMKEAKDIDVSIIHPVTEINQDKVDQYYADGNEYNPKKPFTIKITDPKSDSVPEPIGIGFKIDIALPSVSPNGGLASLNDLVKNGQIPVDDKGNIVGASTKGIPVDKYVEEHCTAEFQEDYHTKGLNIPLYDVKYQLHLWVWTTTAGYVNDFIVEYTLNDEDEATEAGTVQMVLDWLADKNGAVNASNGKQLGTSSYITKLYSKSVAKHRCDYKDQRKGEKTVKKTETTKIFGYKRPKK